MTMSHSVALLLDTIGLLLSLWLVYSYAVEKPKRWFWVFFSSMGLLFWVLMTINDVRTYLL